MINRIKLRLQPYSNVVLHVLYEKEKEEARIYLDGRKIATVSKKDKCCLCFVWIF